MHMCSFLNPGFPTPEGAYLPELDQFHINVNVPPMSASEERSSSSDLAVVFRCIQTALLCSLERR